MQRTKRILWTLVALVILALSWLWDHLHPIVAAIIAILPLKRVKEAVRQFIAGLAPYPTLMVFLIPAVAHELMKAAAFWLFHLHMWLTGVTLYLLADIFGIALCAFIFEANREKLLSIRWFNRGYLWFVAAHDWARAQIAPMKAYVRAALEAAGLADRRAGFVSRVLALWRYARRRTRAA